LSDEGPISATTVAEAAASVAVCPKYIIAARQILKTGDEQLLRVVLFGETFL
jgi:hypothetical protein